MGAKRIKLTIDSNLTDVFLIGMAINKLCSMSPFSDVESYQIELCVVEAVNNVIEHAYQNQAGHEVEVVFTLYPDRFTLDICDAGKPMDPNQLEQKEVPALSFDPEDLDHLPEGGWGLAIIKQIMDKASYKTVQGKNILTLTKWFKSGEKPMKLF
jgi:anti-sigma regulatory factor (Ser/Thr protein kinase)